MRLALLGLVVACSTDVAPPTGVVTAIDPAQCAVYGYTCGHVYEFEAPDVELCVVDEDLAAAQLEYGRARLSSRLADGNLCLWRCDGEPGCNALSGCWGCS